MKNRKKRWYQRRIVRIIICVGSSLGITILGSMLSNFAGYRWWCAVIVILMLTALNVGTEVSYSTVDKNREEIFASAEKTTTVHAKLFSSLISILRRGSQGLSKIAHFICSKGVVPENRWTSDDSCNEVCSCILFFLKERMVKGSDIRIFYDKLIDESEGTIKRVGFANEGLIIPTLLGKKRNINSQNAYYDCKMFQEGNPDAVYKIRPKEVDAIMTNQEHGKYSQCMLIPACRPDGKMVGLLQIFIEEGSLLVEMNKSGLKKMKKEIRNQINIFIEALVLLQEAEEAALAIPNSSGKGQC